MVARSNRKQASREFRQTLQLCYRAQNYHLKRELVKQAWPFSKVANINPLHTQHRLLVVSSS
jgi:hypothetical protein